MKAATTYKPRLYRATPGERRNGRSDEQIEKWYRDSFCNEETDYPFLREALVRSTCRKDEIAAALTLFKREGDANDPATKKRVRGIEQELAEAEADVALAKQMIGELPIARPDLADAAERRHAAE